MTGDPSPRDPVTTSLAEVARRAGVSIATASRSLNGSTHPVSRDVRERVLRAAAEIGYTPSPLARALVTRRSGIVGVIVGDIMDPYFAEVARGAEDVARRAGYLTILCDSDRRLPAEVAYVRLLATYHAEGIIFVGGGFTDDPAAEDLRQAVERVSGAGTRVVSMSERGIPGASISVDNRAVAYDMTSYVISLGHRRVAFVEGLPGLNTSAQRLAGFEAAMAEAGLAPQARYAGDYRFEGGQAAALRMIGGELPDAVVAANDESGIGVVMTLRQAGVRVPEDVSVAGIGSTRAAGFVDLTTVSLPLYELGAIAARRIVDRDGWDPHERRLMPHRLVARGTTRRRG